MITSNDIAETAADMLRKCGINSSPIVMDWDTRPDWDTWFMTLALVVAQRSLDPATKHGCVVVDSSRSILSVGYNSPPRGCIDELIPTERPLKYSFFEHSEANAINNAARCGVSLNGATFYVTGPPCTACFRGIINVGATHLVHGPILHQRTQADIDAVKLMNRKSGPNHSSITEQIITIRAIDNFNQIQSLLTQTGDYMSRKKLEQTT